MKRSRKAEIVGFSTAGGVMVLLAILLPSMSANPTLQLLFALAGLFLVQAGIWRITERTVGSQRRFLALRGEIEGFLGLIRTLNAQGVKLQEEDTEERWEAFQKSVDALHAAVDRMADVAGKEI
jgi:uncharacterized protein YdbL (DUF1318 family)